MKHPSFRSTSPVACGFTLIEMLTSMAILGVLSALLFAAFQQGSKAWLLGESRVETFTQARAALDLMSRDLSQAVTTHTVPFLADAGSITLGTVNPLTLQLDNVAFIASVGDRTKGEMDLMEVVYRLSPQKAGISEDSMGPTLGPYFFTDAAPGPYKLIRRSSGFSDQAANCRDYGNFTPGAVPWDFYASPPTWPETSDRTRTAVLATNVVSLQFQFQDAQNPPVVRSYWNSTANHAWQNELGGTGVPLSTPSMQDRAPAVVIITLTMIDARAAARYNATSDQDAKRRIFEESKRIFTTSVSIPNH